jgi:hypothetical protein
LRLAWLLHRLPQTQTQTQTQTQARLPVPLAVQQALLMDLLESPSG